ncbi:MAG: hypothetical protein ACI9WU_004888 [Myxococcota bacterium]|jgi:hypothetical protein
MQVAFAETMAGTLTLDAGGHAPIFFTVSARAPGARSFLTGEPMSLRGTITVGEIARDAPVAGTLQVCLARLSDKELIYKLDFTGEDGGAYAFMGQKNVSFRRAVGTMTTLMGRLYRGSRPIGRGELTFDMKHLPGFLGSFRLG